MEKNIRLIKTGYGIVIQDVHKVTHHSVSNMDLPLLSLIFASILVVIRGQVSLSLSVRFVIYEEVPNDTLVGNIANESRIRTRANMTTEEFETLRYEFLDQSSMENLFTVKERTGNLLTSGRLDREKVCPFKELCLLEFDVLVHSSLNVIIVSVEIEVMDKNDHFPIFPSKVVTTSMIESFNNGSTLTLSEATDLDSTSINNIQSYEIIPNNGTFYLNASRKQNGGFDLKLVLRQSLDREIKDFYVFHIIAKDGGNPSNMGSVEVNINVLDSNDNYPVFNQEFYTSNVKEGSVVGTTVVQVTATDKDIGENGQISYRFSSRQTDPNVDQLFSINSTSGVLSVKGNLVYEPNKSYKIYVDAMDQGEQPQVTQTTILVTVLDAGNNKPNVRVNFLAQTNAEIINNISVVYVLESSPQNSVIAHVTVDDTDSGQNGLIGCNLSDNSFSIKQLTSGKGYILSIKTQLNREQIPSHNITVTCFDHGTPQLSSSVFFKVIVTDTNDNAPTFLKHTYFASIEEGNVIGFIVDQVSAEDIDIGRNAKIMYYLDKDSGGKFAINSNTGVITANTVFDRESALRHLFTVLAVDSGNPPMTGTATVILTVKDKNDNAPEFDVPSFQFFITENLPGDVSVGTLNAKDLDEGDNKKISFSISPEYESTMPFVIYSDGLVKTARELDREVHNKYKFNIVATDHWYTCTQ
ncbi:hypothetical protein KUTeg_024252 [Tegillarca granosa]|uniref:Cadherin domain-containing protein n=1 Tax=Tegillarca granosa TaxID=220873 RepID=A0ABQ9DZV3_TEGGR|nr:hypothetical protein KUTeg_024252 [Tegillarca granosa]